MGVVMTDIHISEFPWVRTTTPSIDVLNNCRWRSKTVATNLIAMYEQALKAGAPLTPHKYLKVGQKCRVTAGPLLGLEGVVAQTQGAARLVLQVDMLGQAASVEIDLDMIETLD